MANTLIGTRIYFEHEYYDIIGAYTESSYVVFPAPGSLVTLGTNPNTELVGVVRKSKALYYVTQEDKNPLLTKITDGIYETYETSDKVNYLVDGRVTANDTAITQSIKLSGALFPYYEYEILDIGNNDYSFRILEIYNVEKPGLLYLDTDRIDVTTLEFPDTLVPNPSNASTVNSLDMVTITSDRNVTIDTNLWNIAGLYGDYGKPCVSIQDVSIDNGNTIKVSFSGSESIQNGNYYFYIPNGAIIVDGNGLQGMSFSVTVLSNEGGGSTEGGGGELSGEGSGEGENPSPSPNPEPLEEMNYVAPESNYLEGLNSDFDGLIKYYRNNSIISASNTHIKRIDDIVYVDKNYITKISILPVLRTRVLYGNNTPVFIKYYHTYQIPVILTLDMYNGIDHSVKTYNITYDELHKLPIEDFQKASIKIQFKIDENTMLERTIQIQMIPQVLMARMFNNNNDFITANNKFDITTYDSRIDLISGTPEVTKWGCLLVTNTYDVIETTEVEVNGETVLKGVGELLPITKVRMGNLSGIYNETFENNQPHGYGLYGESVYLTGNFYLNNGKSLIDIDKDITMANGNILRILNTLSNLLTSLIDSIYNLTLYLALNSIDVSRAIEDATLALTSTFENAISMNSDALFKLSKDYSLWAVGNAGIAIINPNVQYDENGNIEETTVGDGDEYILLQGERIKISTNIIENNRIRVVCSNIDPQGFSYESDLYRPINSGLTFTIGWIDKNDISNSNIVTRVSVIPSELLYDENNNLISGSKPYRYVALVNNGGQLSIAGSNVSLSSCTTHSFTISYKVLTSNIYAASTGETKLGNSGYYYCVLDITTAGMFVDGLFNADLINASLINVDNLVAVDLTNSNTYRKNPNFNVSNPITDSNYPVINANNNTVNKNAPFAVVSGTTGRITAQGIDLRGATIGDSGGYHLRLTDNIGSDKVRDLIKSGSSSNVNNLDTTPALYIRNGNNIIAKFSGVTSNDMTYYFLGNFENLSVNNTTSLFNNTTITLNRKLRGTSADNGEHTTNGFLNFSYKYNVFSNINNGNYEYYVSSTTHYNLSHTQNADVGAIAYAEGNNTPNDGYYSLADNLNITSRDIDRTIEAGESIKVEGCLNQVKILNNCIEFIPKKLDSAGTNRIVNAANNAKIYGILSPYIPGEYKITLSLIATVDDGTGTTYTETIRNWVYLYRVFMDWKTELVGGTSGTLRYIPYLKTSKQDSLTGDLVFSKIIRNNTDRDKNYKFSLKATVNFKQYSTINNFKYLNQNDPTHDVPTDDGILPGLNAINGDSSSSGAVNLSDSYTAPTDSNYGDWEPLLCPDSYTLRPKIDISSISINISDLKQETIIQGNGFASGYSIADYFSNSYELNGNTLNFNRINLVNGCGTIDSNTGVYNLFRFPPLTSNSYNSYVDFTIHKPIPILYGDINFYSRRSEHTSTLYFSNYKFNGYSLVACNRESYFITASGTVSSSSSATNSGYTNSMDVVDVYSSENPFEQKLIINSDFELIEEDDTLSLLSVNYDAINDLYICVNLKYSVTNNTSSEVSVELVTNTTGTMLIVFGNSWSQLFSKFGTTIFVQLTGKTDVTSFGRYKPAIINLRSIKRGGELLLVRYNGNLPNNSTNPRFYDVSSTLSSYQAYPIEYKLGILIDSFDLDGNFCGNNFNIMVNYIPQMA